MGLGKTTLFPHRHNRNGSWDSICVVCFATVATAVVGAELSAKEATHVCDPGRASHPTTRPLTTFVGGENVTRFCAGRSV